jgi:uncharacterized protein
VNASFLAVIAVALAAAQSPEYPLPRGFVNDFAGVIDAERAGRITRLIELVRARSGGEIAVVTLTSLGGREASDVALRIGREWGVGLDAPVGNRARNAGVVILVVPKEASPDNRGHVAIDVGQGAEGFIPDGAAGAIWREAIPVMQRGAYGAAVEQMTYRVAERYAGEFGFSLDSAGVAAPRPPQSPGTGPRIPVGLVLAFVVLFVVLPMFGVRRDYGRRRRRDLGFLPWLALSALQQRSRGGSRRSSGWSGGSGGGWGGGGGGGFGGFGGGGGFSGGGSSGSW